MTDRMIAATLECLRRDGLKFFGGHIGRSMKNLQKTIYKVFPDKEAPALATYEKYYSEAKKKIGAKFAFKRAGEIR